MQTTITTVFGVLDGDGNAIPQQPITVQVQRFAQDAFTEAHRVIAGARDQALANSRLDSDSEPDGLAEKPRTARGAD